ncbi:unnamed protein product [Adineta ricciae]|uniref:SGNH hydrolase-type esterase domain-containing protein n=1 Tax=Adineta ricciae TaxID=249248 RepID=A0A815S4Y8_ADIRI|nr:unnamed protein product [Adineta ricciae]CAF1616750.1 unnamed protein product [Adineta ricciae]
MALSSIQHESLPASQIDDLINERACFKQRSHDTHMRSHQPQLTAAGELSEQVDIVLLGDSMFERFKNTGRFTQLGLLPYPRLFNAGVGGDKIENVLYRIKLGLLTMLKEKNPKLVVVHIGTNNLQPRKPLHGLQINNYDLLLQTLFALLPVQTKILVTGLFTRKDVEEKYVSQSNQAIKQLVDTIRSQDNDRIQWLEPPEEVRLYHLVDNVHLTEEGYELWDERLYSKIQGLLK